jgi:hypothetical protein
MESQDIMHEPCCDDGTMPDDWPYKEWSEYMDEAADQAERPLTVAHLLKQWYIEAGFVDVQERVIKLPINSWPRRRYLKILGKAWAENLLAGLQGFTLALFSRIFGWNKTEIEVRFPLPLPPSPSLHPVRDPNARLIRCISSRFGNPSPTIASMPTTNITSSTAGSQTSRRRSRRNHRNRPSLPNPVPPPER